jgi:hypothetical protein
MNVGHPLAVTFTQLADGAAAVNSLVMSSSRLFREVLQRMAEVPHDDTTLVRV